MPFHTRTHTYAHPVKKALCSGRPVDLFQSLKMSPHFLFTLKVESLVSGCLRSPLSRLIFNSSMQNLCPDFCNLLMTRCCLRETEKMRSLKRDCGCLGNNLLRLCIICVLPLDCSISNIGLEANGVNVVYGAKTEMCVIMQTFIVENCFIVLKTL